MHHDSCRQKASYDGSTIIARDDDSGSGRYDPKRFVAIAPEVSTDNLYWTNRLIAALADAHFYETSNAIEAFAEAARTYSHRLVEHADAALRNIGKDSDDSAVGDSVAETAGEPIAGRLQAANDEMAEYLRTHATKLLNDVLYTSSNLMRNGFAMSDRWN
ncbi:MAG: C69 family dipeptidase [Bifidobacterium dentium]